VRALPRDTFSLLLLFNYLFIQFSDMRKFILFFICCACTITGITAQTFIIRDNSTAEPISNALVRDKNNKTIRSGTDGKIDASGLNTKDSVWIMHPDYFTWKG
jgi:hypothetical protein